MQEDDSGIEGTVLLRKYENPTTTMQNVLDKVEELNKELPKGIKIEPFYDRTELSRTHN
jgi:cobalt-zinc-cadmium resistance protein CzcA